MTKNSFYLFLSMSFVACPAIANAGEFYIGKPVTDNFMTIEPAYLTGIKMDINPKQMDMDSNATHIEVDVHATENEPHGFGKGDWIPFLKIVAIVEKIGNKYKETKILSAMQAKDGSHYANNFKLAGEGDYKITYTFFPPSVNGFIRHIDAETGIPQWWKPFSKCWQFHYPSRPKGDYYTNSRFQESGDRELNASSI